MIRFARAALLSSAVLGASATATLAQDAGDPAKDSQVARCVLQNIGLARGKGSAELIAEACRALVRDNQGDASDPSYALVKCFVPGDPEWVEFRLLTRTQCSNASGIVGG